MKVVWWPGAKYHVKDDTRIKRTVCGIDLRKPARLEDFMVFDATRARLANERHGVCDRCFN